MAAKSVAEKWLIALTRLSTASGLEQEVMRWVQAWAGRRPDLRLRQDSGGNLLITQRRRKTRAPVVAVAHMDHPGFVVTSVDGEEVSFEFRGGVRPEYFERASVDFAAGGHGRVSSYDPTSHVGAIRMVGSPPAVGEIARWRFQHRKAPPGRLLAPACDDLAGCAAALAALDRSRDRPGMGHFAVLLTRAEEMGFVGALHAAKEGTVDPDARILSIETSRASSKAPIGGGPVIRVGDAATVFDDDLTNRISRAAAKLGIRHQRQLMAGGTCEATAFGVLGYRATGLCLALGNYHNQGDLDEVEAGSGKATPVMEEISLDDFHGLIDLLLIAADAVDGDWDLPRRLDSVYADGRHLLG
ncbi:MAG: M20/M25/M40 family metallo-hydrolase [Acidimicrobiia bacterium]